MRTILGAIMMCAAVVIAVIIVIQMPVTVSSATFVASMPDVMGNAQSVDMRPVASGIANVGVAFGVVVLGFVCASAIQPKPREPDEHRLPGCV